MRPLALLRSLSLADKLWLLVALAGLVHYLVLSAFGDPFNLGTLTSLGVACLGALVVWLHRTGRGIASLGPRGARAFQTLVVLAAVTWGSLAGWMIRQAQAQDDQPVDMVIVLGAGLKHDRPSPTLERRIARAAEYLRAHEHTPVIVCGGVGRGQTRSEAEAIRDGLVASGVGADRIVLEARSTSTDENLRFAKELAARAEPIALGPRALIVTSNYHVGRAKILARRNGFVPFGLPAETPWYVLPNAALRESLAIVKTVAMDR